MKCIATWIALAAATAHAGEIQGTIRLPNGIDPSLSPAVVYIAAKPDALDAAASTPAIVDQRDLRFVPRVQAVVVGTPIVFHNSDREAHNVSSQSGCCTFNFMVAPRGEQGPGRSQPVETTRPGLIRLLCNIHQQMRGYVMVCPTAAFAVSDAAGRFRIAAVPDGVHKVHVWQEFAKPYSVEIAVAGSTVLDVELESAGPVHRAAGAVQREAAVPWGELVRRIGQTLERAIEAAVHARGAEAERLVLDAYFEHFEAGEMEAAVRLFCGEQRVFDLERQFMRLRKPLMSDLAAGRADAATVRDEVARLTSALEHDVRLLQSKGVRDRSTLYGGATPVAAEPRIDAANVSVVLSDLRRAFARVRQSVAARDGPRAASLLADAYFEVFHRIEPALASRSIGRTRSIEGRFLELRGRLQGGLSAAQADVALEELHAEIEAAARSLEDLRGGGTAALVNGFWNAFVIIVREGAEALLIVTALLLYLTRLGRVREKRVIYWGVAAAAAATIVTWCVLQWLIARSGLALELIEGTASLIAAGLLFYVSYWLVSKAEARRWQEFLTQQVGQGLSAGSLSSLGLAAFLAVYREGAETIFMFQPILVDPSPHELLGVVAGVALGVLVLAVVWWGLRFASVRMAIRPFFRVTGGLLFVLAVVFAGKAVIELQEATVLSVSPLPAALGAWILAVPVGIRDALGLAPNVQAVAIQATILLGACISLIAVSVAGQVNRLSVAGDEGSIGKAAS